MALKVKTVERDSRTVTVTYTMTHTGPRTTLELELAMAIASTGVRTAMSVEGPECGSPDEALDRLAEWLERSAQAIRDRRSVPGVAVQFYGDGPEPPTCGTSG